MSSRQAHEEADRGVETQVGKQTKAMRQSDRQPDGRYSWERLKEKSERHSEREGLSKTIFRASLAFQKTIYEYSPLFSCRGIHFMFHLVLKACMKAAIILIPSQSESVCRLFRLDMILLQAKSIRLKIRAVSIQEKKKKGSSKCNQTFSRTALIPQEGA